jgi:hypothetical protein
MKTTLGSIGIVLAAVALVLLPAGAQAREGEFCDRGPAACAGRFAAVVPGASVRNGDLVAVDGLGVLLLSTPSPVALVIRGELGLGGSSAGIGLATNAFGSASPGDWRIDDFLGSGILSLEARVSRMYGPTTWRSATYIGGQLSFACIIFKPALAWMVAADDPRDEHFQIVLAGVGW